MAKRRLSSRFWIPVGLCAGFALVAAVGFLLRRHAEEETNQVALSQSPKEVTVVRATAADYQPRHRYVGTLRPWVEAKVGPQFIAEYVTAVLVRPGAEVKKGQVLATLDCRDPSARSHAVALQAQAIQAQQLALAAQAQRMTGLLDGGFIAANEVDLHRAESSSQAAKFEAERATLVDTQLAVNDCVMRAPFDGDVGDRWLDPGAFVHPGEPIVSVIDRRIVRLVVDVPEDDFDAVAPGAEGTIHLVAVNRDLKARVSRRSPAADPTTRTVHIEIDLPDPLARLPVNTTAELWMGVGQPVPATRLPLVAADLTQDHAKVFEVEGERTHALTVPTLGEAGGDLFLSREKVPPGTQVVLEGRMGLDDGDVVAAKERPEPLADSGANARNDAASLPSAQ